MISAKKTMLLVFILTLAAGCATTHNGLTPAQYKAAMKQAVLRVQVPATVVCKGIERGMEREYKGVSHNFVYDPMGDGCAMQNMVFGIDNGPMSGVTQIQVLPDGSKAAKITTNMSTPRIRSILREWVGGY